MKATALVIVGRTLAAIACVLAAGLLAYEGKLGWGWFLFAAVWLGAITATEGVGNKVEGS
jgi:hypothetical protein